MAIDINWAAQRPAMNHNVCFETEDAMPAKRVPDVSELRGSGFGAFNFVSGLVAIPASVLAGALWDWRGPAVTFTAGATFSLLALAGLIWWRSRYPRNAPQVPDSPA